MNRVRGVVFDLGGVVFESPLSAIARFEVEHELPPGFVNRTVFETGDAGAWAAHERGEIERHVFLADFAEELRGAGHEVNTFDLMATVEASIAPRPEMVTFVESLRSGEETGERLAVAALTNNWSSFAGTPITDHFDVFVESVTEGVRKPEVEIYRRTLDRLGLPAAACVMLDDLGPNLKPARALGMQTIKVESPAQAIADLRRLLVG